MGAGAGVPHDDDFAPFGAVADALDDGAVGDVAPLALPACFVADLEGDGGPVGGVFFFIYGHGGWWIVVMPHVGGHEGRPYGRDGL